MVHGAVLPPHVLVQENDHGARLVGYGCANNIGENLRVVSKTFDAFYPQPARGQLILTPQLDLIMSARCIVALLGGDPGTGALPAAVPAPLASVVRQVAMSDPTRPLPKDAWAIREEIGGLAEQTYGPPQFVPIVMPS